jgi:hypothetical protein
MARAFITEYIRSATNSEGLPIPAGQEPAIAYQAFDFTGTATPSAAFNSRTTFIRVDLDTQGYTRIGANPTAETAKATRIQADVPEFFGVTPNHKLSVIV